MFKLLFSDYIAMFYMIYFKFKKYSIVTCAAVDLILTKFQIFLES